MSNVTIVGAGMMGTAMAWPLSDNGHHVRLVGTHLDTEIIASCLKKRCHPRLRRRLLGRNELPLMRCLCRVITENAPADVDFDRLFQNDLK
jgi:glycerol-3-phosphate dehydrogenase